MGSDRSLSLLLPVVAGLCALFWPPCLPFLFPGFLVFMASDQDWTLSDRLVLTVFLSLAFWITLLWPLDLTGIALTWACYAVAALSLGVYAWLVLVRGRPAPLALTPRDLLVLTVFGLYAMLRFRPMGMAVAPSGADMSMHSYITELLVWARGVPDSYQPLLNVDVFSAFPVGFHTVAAIMSLLGSVAPWKAAFAMACASYLLLAMGLYALVRETVGWRAALLASALPLFLQDPQGFAGWGGNPTVMALAFVPMLLVAERTLRRDTALGALLCLAFLCALFLTHAIVFVQTFYLCGAALAASLVAARVAGGRKALPGKAYVLALAAVAGLFFLLVTPYLARVDFAAIDAWVLDWIRGWVREAGHAWHGSLGNAAWSVPAYVFHRLDLLTPVTVGLLVLALLGLPRMWRGDRAGLVFWLVFTAAAGALVVNCRYWVLPLSYLVYPERTAAMLVMALAVLCASGAATVLDLLEPRHRDRLFQAVLAAALVFGVYQNEGAYTMRIAGESTVTRSDMACMRWMDVNLPPDAVIENNYVDAGTWIPAIIGRKVTNPHVNIAVLFKNTNPERGRFVFVGAKPVYGEPALKARELAEQPDRYQPIYASGASVVFLHKD